MRPPAGCLSRAACGFVGVGFGRVDQGAAARRRGAGVLSLAGGEHGYEADAVNTSMSRRF